MPICAHNGLPADRATGHGHYDVSHGKEKLHDDSAIDTAPEWAFCACNVAGSATDLTNA